MTQEALKLALEALPCCGYADASAVKFNPHNQVVQCHNCGQIYTATPQRKPLTHLEIWNTYKNLWMFHHAEEPRLAGDVLKFARAIEAAHGIKE